MTFEVSCPAACRSAASWFATRRVQRGLPVEDGLLGEVERRVEWSEHGHGEDHVAVPAAHVDIAEAVVRDAPSVVGDPVQVGRGHVRGVGLVSGS